MSAIPTFGKKTITRQAKEAKTRVFPPKRDIPFRLPSLTDGRVFFISSIKPHSLSLPSKRKSRICSCHYNHCVVYSLSSANKALLLSNLGRLMRLCAQGVGGVETKLTGRRGEFSQEERSYFNKVPDCF